MGFLSPKSKVVVLLFCFVLLALPQILAFTTVHASADREWTFMVYLDADNNLESAGIKDVNEMEKVGSSNSLAAIVLMDRIPGYDSSNDDWTETRRYYVTKDSDTENINSDLLENMGELNMGDSNTLSSFLIWAAQTYPAQHYALILWDHGGSSATGPGVCWDDTDNEDCLTMAEIKEALTNFYSTTGKKIDVLAFDACLLGMIEVAYQISDYANYMIGSEEIEPGDGYPYDMILTELTTFPSMSPAQLATTIVTKYVSSYTDGLPDPEDDPSITSAAFNLTKTGETAATVSQLAEAIIGDFNNTKNAVRSAWEHADTFHGDFVDLHHFTQLLKDEASNATIKTEAQSVLDAVDSLIISEGHGTVHLNANGVSIYYPSKYDRSFCTGLDFASDTLWDEFLDFATNIDAETTPVCPPYTSDENIIFMDVGVGDIDGDDQPEIVAVGNYSDFTENVYFIITVFDITENGLVQLCNLTLNLGYFEVLLSVTCVDVDNDMTNEIVACGGYYDYLEDAWYSYIGVFTVEEDEVILQAYDEGADISVESLDVVDVDGDNFPEIVISGRFWDWDGSVYAYVAVGNNSAVDSIDLECSYEWYIGYDADLRSVSVGDTDADGLSEIVVGGVYYDHYIDAWIAYVAVLNCSQNLLYLQAYDEGAYFWINSVDVADVDGDGFNEIVISGYCWGYDGIYMFISIGSNLDPDEIFGLGTYYWIVSGDSFICSIDVADIDGDGIAEIIAVGYYYDAQSLTWRSYSTTLSWSQTTGLVTENTYEGDSQTYTYSVTTGDVDNDAQTELITCSEEKSGSSRAKIEVVEASNHVVTNGTISGVVTDGETPMSNATVEVSISRLSVVASVNTLVNGSYTVTSLPEGCYKVTVYAERKTNSTQNGVSVKAGQTTKLDFALIENTVATASHLVNVNEQIFYVVTVSNSTISDFTFNRTAKSITFSAAAATGSTGFCNITFLKNLLGAPYTVKIDDNTTEPMISSNETHTTIHISYTHSIHTIEIVGSTVIPEFSTTTLLLLSACISSLFAFLMKKTKGS